MRFVEFFPRTWALTAMPPLGQSPLQSRSRTSSVFKSPTDPSPGKRSRRRLNHVNVNPAHTAFTASLLKEKQACPTSPVLICHHGGSKGGEFVSSRIMRSNLSEPNPCAGWRGTRQCQRDGAERGIRSNHSAGPDNGRAALGRGIETREPADAPGAKQKTVCAHARGAFWPIAGPSIIKSTLEPPPRRIIRGAAIVDDHHAP